jgi:peptidoglycan hydrolase CwlO-like protein
MGFSTHNAGGRMIRKTIFVAVLALTLTSLEGMGSGKVLKINRSGVLAEAIASETNPPSPQDNNEQYQKLQDELKKLLDELNRLGNDMQDKVRNEIIPFLKKEIEKLREQIRRFRMEEEKPQRKGSTWT